MAFDLNLRKFLKLAIAGSLYSMSAGYAATPLIKFESPMGYEQWAMSGNPLRCGLSLNIPNYGVAYFEQYATKQPHFILRTWEEVLRSAPATVSARSPVWKPGGLNFVVARTYVKPGEFGIYLQRESALKLLGFLSLGLQANFDYHSAEGFNVSVILSPIRFKKVYSEYQKCLSGLFDFNYEAVKETIFHFGVDSKELTDADKDQLKRIAKYVAVDQQIETIRVLGYADESGRKGYNNAVSQFRAEAVQKYLIKIGVPKKKLSVTWFGALKPVGRNDTDEGRAENRRVVINLIKR